MSDQSEAEEEIQQQHSESEVNHEVENSNQQHHNYGDMNHDDNDSTHQQPLLCDSGIYNDGQEDEVMVIYHLVVWMIIN